ncbi:endoglucanase 5 [Andrographis paniculata]|uniref:endoglucanase 5 n=1 Tax=Andrographis paniculata TaxID=175694 RepID=UPI0021E810E7|nr:endoglucanase 5 [Andrographis paniculata]
MAAPPSPPSSAAVRRRLLLILLAMAAIHGGAGALAFNNNNSYGYNYADALDKTFLFFEAQRSGKLPAARRVAWRGDSGLSDGYGQGANLVGGYYDAGDHVKFGQPMAFAVTMLAWAAVDCRRELAAVNQMGHALEAIKWGTDYFIKAHPQPSVLWAQVGDGASDHYCWERAEDMTTSRTAYKLDPEHPGSDLAGETAAALAAAALAFKDYDSAYSNLLLVHAKQIFSFADRFRGFYDDSIQNAKNFYDSSSYSDELLWAAAWLYRASGDNYYLKYTIDNCASLGGTGWAVKEFSWDNKYAGIQILLTKVLFDGAGGEYESTLQQYRAKADYFTCACMQKNDGYNAPMTPGGLLYIREWNNLQYSASAAFLLSVYSDYLSKAKSVVKCPDAQLLPQELLNFAKSQADYILGKNPESMSYLVGYGRNYPVHVHHRGASITPVSILHSPVGCVEGFETWYKRLEPNPNVIYGALVGGPNSKDKFFDDRSNYEQTEPTLSGTAPLVGLFSKLCGLDNKESPKPSDPYNKPRGPYNKELPRPSNPYNKPQEIDVPVRFLHSITNTWNVGSESFYRHKVIVKNVSPKPIREIKFRFEGLTGSLWGLSPAPEKNTYQLPEWIQVLEPGSECTFVYVQGGPQAKVSVQSYH